MKISPSKPILNNKMDGKKSPELSFLARAAAAPEELTGSPAAKDASVLITTGMGPTRIAKGRVQQE